MRYECILVWWIFASPSPPDLSLSFDEQRVVLSFELDIMLVQLICLLGVISSIGGPRVRGISENLTYILIYFQAELLSRYYRFGKHFHKYHIVCQYSVDIVL